ncbi:AHH domain-containing protein [Holosporaceae bacterium 'Namur']|nr:AHH domain-containing protein [Holosporaceae bacterium 'Namur']
MGTSSYIPKPMDSVKLPHSKADFKNSKSEPVTKQPFKDEANKQSHDLLKDTSHKDASYSTPVKNKKIKEPKDLFDESTKCADEKLHKQLHNFITEDKKLWEDFQSGKLKRSDFQVHHMVSNKNDRAKYHDLWELSGLKFNDGINKILLPGAREAHPTRSVHNGRHTDNHNDRIIKLMNEIEEEGLANSWNQERFRTAFQKILVREREGLLQGKINLYE